MTMDHYENAYEKLKDVDSKRENVDLDDFEEFMRKVEEVNKMVHALTSNNKSEYEEATQNATAWLKNHKKEKRNCSEVHEEVLNEPLPEKKLNKNINKTSINAKDEEKKNAVRSLDNINTETMSQDDFMKSVEEDAKRRSDERRERKVKSDAFKEKAKKAFLEKDYEKALLLYNKAITVRKDSYVLYTNRALTLLTLGLYSQAVEDCDTAMKLNESNFKASMYKGKAYFLMGEDEKTEKWMAEVRKMFPDKLDLIDEYQKSWNEDLDNN